MSAKRQRASLLAEGSILNQNLRLNEINIKKSYDLQYNTIIHIFY